MPKKFNAEQFYIDNEVTEIKRRYSPAIADLFRDVRTLENIGAGDDAKELYEIAKALMNWQQS